MGRTTSRIQQKIEDLLSSNPLPKVINVAEKLTETIGKTSDNVLNRSGGSFRRKEKKIKKNMLALPESTSLSDYSESLCEEFISDKMLCDDSGFFEETLASTSSSTSSTPSRKSSRRGRRGEHHNLYDVGDCEDSSSNILDSSYDAQEDAEVNTSNPPEILPLRPLYFEVPGTTDPLMIRLRVQKEVRAALAGKKNRGVVVTGRPGAGKTSLLLDMVKHSYFGGSNTSDPFYAGIVGYHFVQAADPTTTDAARLVHSLAAQLTQHPALRAYRDHLLAAPDLVSLLSLRRIRENPSVALKRAVLDPLRQLYREDRLEVNNNGLAVILIDGLDQEPADSAISRLIATNILRFPHWLKLVLTHRSADEELVRLTHLPALNLDDHSEEDIAEYVESRIFGSKKILSQVADNDRLRKNVVLVKLVNFIVENSRGSYLYPKTVLDLLSHGYITVRSTSFRHLPHSLNEAYHLYMSIQFPTAASYLQQAARVFSLCLASPRPLFLPQVKRLLSVNDTTDDASLDYRRMAGVLPTRSDGSLMFVHPEFVVWLTGPQSTRFRVSATDGHNTFLKYYDSVDIVHTSEALDLVHHLSAASLFSPLPSDDINNDTSDDINNNNNKAVPGDKYPSETDKKFLYLTYKVDRRLLAKCSRVAAFSSFVNSDSVRLLNLAIGSNNNVIQR